MELTGSVLLDLIQNLLLDLTPDAHWDTTNDPMLYFIVDLFLELMDNPTRELLNEDLFSDVIRGPNLRWIGDPCLDRIRNLFLNLVKDPGLQFMGTPGLQEVQSDFSNLVREPGLHLIGGTLLQQFRDKFLKQIGELGLLLARNPRLHLIQNLFLKLIRARLWQPFDGAVMNSCCSCREYKSVTHFSPQCVGCLFLTFFPAPYAPTQFPYVGTGESEDYLKPSDPHI
jgi:hypothetical protein